MLYRRYNDTDSQERINSFTSAKDVVIVDVVTTAHHIHFLYVMKEHHEGNVS